METVKCDIKIILLHGGREFYRFPTPRMKLFSHQLIDEGADCIIWHHSHCSSGFEYYHGKYISYGIGNFLFDYDINYKNFFKSYFIEITITDDGRKLYKVIPYWQHRDGTLLQLMENEEKVEFIKEINKISEVISDDQLFKDEWEKFCDRARDEYLAGLLGYGRIFQRMGKVDCKYSDMKLLKKYGVSEKELLKLASMLRCETHREIFLKIIEKYVNKGEIRDDK